MSQIVFVVAGAVLAMACYLVFWTIRSFFAWAGRKEGPRERVAVYLVAAAIFGSIGGGLSHKLYADLEQCTATGRAVGDCIFSLPQA